MSNSGINPKKLIPFFLSKPEVTKINEIALSNFESVPGLSIHKDKSYMMQTHTVHINVQ